MSIAERVKQIRKIQGLSQTVFGEKLGVSRNTINDIENSRLSPKEIFIQHLCTVFSVNEEWLRTGEGEMLNSADDDILAEIAKKYGADELDQQIIEVFLRLPPEQRKAFSSFAKELAAKVNPDDGKVDK